MHKLRFSKKRVVSILKEYGASASFVDLDRCYGVNLNHDLGRPSAAACKAARSHAAGRSKDENTRVRRIIAKPLAQKRCDEKFILKILGSSRSEKPP
jgi:hypothetical protein